MKDRAPSSRPAEAGRRPRLRRRLLLFLLGATAWTLLSCYPNPTILARNLARYRRLPIDPEVEKKMGWSLPADAMNIELFVDTLLVPTPDWPLYRVPWYVPDALEAARSRRGDCETKAILFASLLAGRDLPFEIRASFNHIWVDYPGRRARGGEAEELAYLEGEPGRLRLHWPGRVAWREALAAQRDQLWDAMPLARKVLWLVGILWVGLSAMLLRGPRPEGELISEWRVRGRDYLARAAWAAAVVLAFIALGPNLRPDAGPVRWTIADLREVLVLAIAAGAFLAWLSVLRSRRAVAVAENGAALVVTWSLGLRQRNRALAAPEIARLELEASPGGPRPWILSAALRTGERILLLHYRQELAAREALRRLGCALGRPLLVRSGKHETRTMADEISLSLGERAARRPAAPAPERPRGCVLEVEESNGGWAIHLPAPGRRAGLELLGFAAAPLIFLAFTTYAILRFPAHFILWVAWITAVSLVGVAIYLAILLRGEITAYLARSRVEIGEGLLRYFTAEGRAESVALDRIETIELARRGEAPTIAIVSPDRVIHLRGLCPGEHREWLRRTIEQIAAKAGQV